MHRADQSIHTQKKGEPTLENPQRLLTHVGVGQLQIFLSCISHRNRAMQARGGEARGRRHVSFMRPAGAGTREATATRA